MLSRDIYLKLKTTWKSDWKARIKDGNRKILETEAEALSL